MTECNKEDGCVLVKDHKLACVHSVERAYAYGRESEVYRSGYKQVPFVDGETIPIDINPCQECLNPSMPYGTCMACGRKWGICKDAVPFVASPGVTIGEEPTDMVNSPPHYDGPVECIEVLEFLDLPLHLAQSFRYLWRCGKKENMKEDVKKARWYIERWLSHEE